MSSGWPAGWSGDWCRGCRLNSGTPFWPRLVVVLRAYFPGARCPDWRQPSTVDFGAASPRCACLVNTECAMQTTPETRKGFANTLPFSSTTTSTRPRLNSELDYFSSSSSGFTHFYLPACSALYICESIPLSTRAWTTSLFSFLAYPFPSFSTFLYIPFHSLPRTHSHSLVIISLLCLYPVPIYSYTCVYVVYTRTNFLPSFFHSLYFALTFRVCSKLESTMNKGFFCDSPRSYFTHRIWLNRSSGRS